jgi:hypothetical protein
MERHFDPGAMNPAPCAYGASVAVWNVMEKETLKINPPRESIACCCSNKTSLAAGYCCASLALPSTFVKRKLTMPDGKFVIPINLNYR